MTDVAFPSLTLGEKIFKDLAWDTLVTAALTALGINFWPINSIIKVITNKLFDVMKLAVDLEAITLVNAEHKRDYDKASVVLKIIAIDKGIDSDEFKKARDNAKIALSKYVRFGAVA